MLILSGVQYGLPISDSLIAAATTALQSKGVSAKDIYVEYLDLARNIDPHRRVALAGLLRNKFAKTNLGLVIVMNQAGLEFIAKEGSDLIPPDVPVLISIVQKTQVAWGNTPRSIMNVVGQPDVAGGLNDATRALIQGGVQDIYQQFLTIVAGARKMPVAEVAPIAEGRVWSGMRAKELKLIDRYGDLPAAIREAARQAGLKGEPRILVMRQPQPFLVQMLSKLTGGSTAPAQDAMARAVAISRMRAAAQVEAAIAVAKGPTVQAHCLTCTGYSVPAGAAARTDIPAIVKSLLAD